MLARRISTHAPRRSILKFSQKWPTKHRPLSTAPAPSPHPPSPPHHATIATITTDLDRLAPRINLSGSQIRIITNPPDFHAALRAHIAEAEQHVFLSTLYIGREEHSLIACLRSALLARPALRVSILTDALRGTREAPSAPCSASLLAGLAADFPARVEVRMYHTPTLNGWRKRLAPRRVDEGWGLQHMKAYGSERGVLLSGANLSRDYFVDRQDRCHAVDSARAAAWFAEVHKRMCRVSYRLRPVGKSADAGEEGQGQNQDKNQGWALEWPSDNAAPEPLVDPTGYVRAATALFSPLVAPHAPPDGQEPPPRGPSADADVDADTTLHPVLSLPPTLNTELPVLKALLSPALLPSRSSYTFAAGYFNPHPAVTEALLRASSTTITTAAAGGGSRPDTPLEP